MRSRPSPLLVLAATFTGILAAQKPAAQFDAASLKASPERTGEAGFTHFSDTPGRLTYQNITPKLLISLAWEIDSDRILEHREKWLDTARFDLSAVFPADTTKTKVREMLRTLLSDSFALDLHTSYKNAGALELTAGAKGAKLTEAAPGADGGVSIFHGRIVGHGMSMDNLAGLLSRQIGREVVNKTGQSGLYEVDLKWAPEAAAVPGAESNDLSGSIEGALSDQLGLRLHPTSTKARVEYLVIDKATRPATDQ